MRPSSLGANPEVDTRVEAGDEPLSATDDKPVDLPAGAARPEAAGRSGDLSAAGAHAANARMRAAMDDAANRARNARRSTERLVLRGDISDDMGQDRSERRDRCTGRATEGVV